MAVVMVSSKLNPNILVKASAVLSQNTNVVCLPLNATQGYEKDSRQAVNALWPSDVIYSTIPWIVVLGP